MDSWVGANHDRVVEASGDVCEKPGEDSGDDDEGVVVVTWVGRGEAEYLQEDVGEERLR